MKLMLSKIDIMRKLVQIRDKKISNGIITTKNIFGKKQYALTPAKQKPLVDTFELIEKEKSKNITNLTNELKRVYYNGVEFTTLFEEQPHLNRTVGSLPQKWGKKVGKSKEKREQIDQIFKDFAKNFNEKIKTEKSDTKISTKPIKKGLSKILGTKVKVEELGKGAWGQTYKINADNQDYVLKVYYQNSPEIYGGNKHCHGNYFELSSAMWATKNDADHYATCYMGRFGENLDGYLLSKYIPPTKKYGRKINNQMDIAPKNFSFSRFFHKLNCNDLTYNNSRNMCGKKIVDFGNTNPTFASKLETQTYILAKTMGRFIDENNSKGLNKIKKEHFGTKKYEDAVSFLRFLINKYGKRININTLKTKKDLLKTIGLDYTPDIRIALGKIHDNIKKGYRIDTDNFDEIYDVPMEELLTLSKKYRKEL